MPVHVPTRPVPRTARRQLAAALAVTAVLVVVGAVLAAPAVLAVALGSLALAAAAGLRGQWHAAAPLPAAPAGVPSPTSAPTSATAPAADVTAALRELRTAYTEKVGVLLDAGREDLAAELCDEYTDLSLRVLTGTPADRRRPTTDGPTTAGPTTLPRTFDPFQEDDVHLTATLKNLLRRFDRYTLEAFRPAAPYRNELVRSGR